MSSFTVHHTPRVSRAVIAQTLEGNRCVKRDLPDRSAREAASTLHGKWQLVQVERRWCLFDCRRAYVERIAQIDDLFYLAFILYRVIFRCMLVARTQIVLFMFLFPLRSLVLAAVEWLGKKDFVHKVL